MKFIDRCRVAGCTWFVWEDEQGALFHANPKTHRELAFAAFWRAWDGGRR